MTGKMTDIIEKIGAARNTFFHTNGFLPNTIKMSMADYRATLELGDPNINVGMHIVKRSGEMECAFEEAVSSSAKMIDGACVHGNDVMTCAKCIPPIANKEDAGILPYPEPIVFRRDFPISVGKEIIKTPTLEKYQ